MPPLQRFGSPFSVHDSFEDVALFKLAIDVGGGSTKGIMNLVNVRNPQGMEHVRPFLEFSGVKDSAHNLREAAFKKTSPIISDFEDIMNQWCVVLVCCVGHVKQVAIACNCNANHDMQNPKPLSTLSGYYECIANTTATIENCVADIDFDLAQSTKLLFNPAKSSFMGLTFFNDNGISIRTAYYILPIKCFTPETSPTNMLQLIIAGILSSDLELLSKFFGHQGAFVPVLPCNV